jgi:hypothetical protein
MAVGLLGFSKLIYAYFRVIPCIFPCYRDFAFGDRFAYDCAHHHPVSANRRTPGRRQIGRFWRDFRRLNSRLSVSAGAQPFSWRFWAACLCISKFRSRRPCLSTNLDRTNHENPTSRPAKFGGFGPAFQLLRLKAECLELPARLGRWITEPLDTDAAGQAASTVAFTRLGARKASEMVMLACRTLHFSRVQSSATVVTRPETTSSSH